MNTALVMDHVSVSYGIKPVLKDLSLRVEEGSFFIVVGPNGSGKTTLVKTISGTTRWQKKHVEIFGKPLHRHSKKALARNVAVVPQQAPPNIPFSVFEVVLMGRSPHLSLVGLERKKDMKIAEEAMAFTNVDHLAHRKLNQLSGGELQRVIIARAICQQPRLILLDEPTASLDLAHQVNVMDLMERLKEEQGITVIMVSHDLNLAAMYGDQLLLLKDGEQVSLGRPDLVLTYGQLERAYGCTLLVDENPLGKVPRVTPVPGKFF